MKNCIKFSIIGLMISTSILAKAQDKKITIDVDTAIKVEIDTTKKSTGKYSISFGPNGIQYESKVKDLSGKKSRFETYWGQMDLGLNLLQDNSTYGASNPLTNKYGVQEDWFDLRNGKSWNVNIYPLMTSFRAVDHKRYRINLYTGLGLQIYNFRYKTSVTQYSEPKDKFALDATTFNKNKLSQCFLTVPLMVNFNHKLTRTNWLTYGFGASVGYSLSTWTKQNSPEYGTVKNHDLFNYNDFNTTLIGEIGFGDFRFYASYQLSNMYKGIALDKHPISFGIRIGQVL